MQSHRGNSLCACREAQDRTSAGSPAVLRKQHLPPATRQKHRPLPFQRRLHSRRLHKRKDPLRTLLGFLLRESKHQKINDDVGGNYRHYKRRETESPYYSHNNLNGHYHQEDISVTIIRPGEVPELHREQDRSFGVFCHVPAELFFRLHTAER